MSRNSFVLAATAAALFVAGAVAPALSAEEEGQIKCEGVNSCKGQSACKTASSECAGHNGCKGKGFVMLAPEECAAAKAKLGAEKK